MGWLLTLVIFLLLACLPLGVRVRYVGESFRAWVLVGKIPVGIYPLPGWLTGRSGRKEKTPEPAVAPSALQTGAGEKNGGSWKKFLPLIQTGLDFLGDFRRKLRVNHLRLKLILAGDDPCDLAVNYGKAWAALGNLLPRLERVFVIRKRDLNVECDFLSEQIQVEFAMDLTITLGRMLGLVVVYGLRLFREYSKMKKGGANQ